MSAARFVLLAAQPVAVKIAQVTIIAQSSAIGSGERGVIRISGSSAVRSVQRFLAEVPETRIVCTSLLLPDFPPLPVKLFVWKHGQSYTGNETVEIHTIGSQVILHKMIASIVESCEDVRLAKPGEFTLQSFLNGRLSLTQAEAVLGIIEAADTVDLETALTQLAGNAAAPLSKIRQTLFDLLTEIEAGLDFTDEDITFIKPETVRNTLTQSLQELETLRQQLENRGLPNEKPRIVLIGKPNAGKSTLFNKLLGRDAAIVSPMEGTTTDYLEEETVFGGIECLLVDTAGVNNSVAYIAGNLYIYCYEVDRPQTGSPNTIEYQTKRPDEDLDGLRQRIAEALTTATVPMLGNTVLRCKESIAAATDSLRRALEAAESVYPDESLQSLEIRNSVNQLGLIDGSVYTDDILDRVFSRFCIGK